ncbi:MAG: hypothetical protein H0X30_09775 [Anaerolineae bacterium]|nr:hypothetical protein [Anaerolineae bacterium]
MHISLAKFKLALTIGVLIAILGLVVAIDHPNNGNVVPVIAAIILGCGTILIETIRPVIAIPLLGFIGFAIVVTTHNLVKWKKWLEAPIAISLAILIILNVIGLFLWATGHVEGYF